MTNIRIAITLMMLAAPLPAVAKTFQAGKTKVNVETIASGLDHPWALAFLPDGALLVTERSGQLRLVSNGEISAPLSGLPKIAAIGQGGLLDVVLDPDFSKNKLIYLTYSEAGPGGAGTAVGRGKLIRNGKSTKISGFKRIFRVKKKSSGGRHFGSRMAFAADKTLFVTLGERGDRDRAQDPFDTAGSIIRINRDGSIPSDNPFADGKKASPEIWSTGHRNPQGAAINPASGKYWAVEHGARGGDEINIPIAGKNYGWPKISYGRHYTGFEIGLGKKAPGYEQPEFFWDPSIAPSGMAFYSGKLFPQWQGDVFVGALKYQLLVRLKVRNGKIVGEERYFSRKFGRIRDVRNGPNGALWLLTDSANGKILKITPASK